MYDQEALADLLAQLATTEDLLTGTGYTAEFLDELTADLETTLSEEFEKLDTNIATEHQCPKCGYEWSGKAK
jgi:rubrerythrin